VYDDRALSQHNLSSAKEELFDILLKDFAALPATPKIDNYAVINVSPPVVPNPYLPTFRIFSYNITGAEQVPNAQNSKKKKKKKKKKKRRHGHHRGDHRDKKSYCKEHQDTWKCRLDQPWHSDPGSPSRTNTLWSPLGYAQVRYLLNWDM
jgi:endopolyphosphatase